MSRQRTSPGWHEASLPGSAARRTRRSPAPWMSSAPSAWISSPAARRAGSGGPHRSRPARQVADAQRLPAGDRPPVHLRTEPGRTPPSTASCTARSWPSEPGRLLRVSWRGGRLDTTETWTLGRKATAPGCSWSTTASTVMTRSSSLPPDHGGRVALDGHSALNAIFSGPAELACLGTTACARTPGPGDLTIGMAPHRRGMPERGCRAAGAGKA